MFDKKHESCWSRNQQTLLQRNTLLKLKATVSLKSNTCYKIFQRSTWISSDFISVLVQTPDKQTHVHLKDFTVIGDSLSYTCVFPRETAERFRANFNLALRKCPEIRAHPSLNIHNTDFETLNIHWAQVSRTVQHKSLRKRHHAYQYYTANNTFDVRRDYIQHHNKMHAAFSPVSK